MKRIKIKLAQIEDDDFDYSPSKPSGLNYQDVSLDEGEQEKPPKPRKVHKDRTNKRSPVLDAQDNISAIKWILEPLEKEYGALSLNPNAPLSKLDALSKKINFYKKQIQDLKSRL